MEWWQRIFNTPLYFELYEAQDTELAKTQVPQVISLLQMTPPSRILDVGCGYGRHSIELARRGFEITGLDISDVQLTRAREKAAAAGVLVDWRQGDSRSMAFEAEFDVAINMFLSFGYFQTDEEHLALLRGVAKALRPGGRFLMDFWNREHEIRGFERWLVERTGEVFEVEEWEFDHLNGRLNWTNYVFFPDGRRDSWVHSIRAYTVVELRDLFDQAGLRLDAVYGSLDGQPFTIDSPAAVFVATKTSDL
ncbi:MAG: class I SAM-dependent methyltransferase [bacterium]